VELAAPSGLTFGAFRPRQAGTLHEPLEDRESAVRCTVVRVEGPRVVFIDMRGKLESESAADYAAYVRDQLTRPGDAECVVCVVGRLGYEPDRDNDIDSLRDSLASVCAVVDRPSLCCRFSTPAALVVPGW
jgi:hypothetical protein